MPDSVGAVRDPGILSEPLNARIPLIATVLPESAITTAETGETFDNLNSADVFGHFVAKLTFETQAQGRAVSERQG